MGQQQLLLVVLVTIIVGIATVVAINVFGSAGDNANVQAVRNDLLSMAASAQAYFMKPTMMGGGSGAFTAITWQDLGGVACSTDHPDATGTNDCANENGVYTFGTKGATLQIQGVPSQAGGSIGILICEDNAATGEYASGATPTYPGDCDPTTTPAPAS